jgi:DNA-binding Xre family transcriptional regulator
MTRALRLRIPELLTDAGLTAWGLHKAAPHAITATMAYRLVRERGQLETFPRKTLEALAAVLNCAPCELLTFDPPPAAPRPAQTRPRNTGKTAKPRRQ